MIKCGVYQAAAVFLFLVLASASLPAQKNKPPIPDEAPVAPEGTQVATEQTPSAATNTDALRKATQNPVASLISVPVQSNSNFGINPGNRTQNVLNIQPVVPVDLSRNWNLIIRWITPIVWQPLPNQPSSPETGVYGLGDMQPTFFLVPKNTGKLIWGGGPILQLPTATNKALGQGKLGTIDPVEDAKLDRRYRRTVRNLILRLHNISLMPFRVVVMLQSQPGS